jgi:hypothetical protein
MKSCARFTLCLSTVILLSLFLNAQKPELVVQTGQFLIRRLLDTNRTLLLVER